jgi:Putative DNA-binding domain
MPSSSLAYEFFKALTEDANPYSNISALVSSQPPTFETEWLDFKGADHLPDENLKEIWSKALSGFANTGAGVLIFGIDARKDQTTGIDCAHKLALAPTAFTLKSRLLELHSVATDPPVQGVQIESYIEAATRQDGFVVCFIPEGSARPHRAEHASRQYYIRCGDDFLVPNVSLLRLLFYPYARSRVTPRLRINDPSYDRRGLKLVLDIILKNFGTVTAHDLFVKVTHDKTLVALASPFKQVHIEPFHNPYSLVVSRQLHPGLDAGLLQLHFNETNDLQNGLHCEVSIFCRDSEPLTWIFDCSAHDLAREGLTVLASHNVSILHPENS